MKLVCFGKQLSLNRCVTQWGADLQTVHFEVCVRVWVRGRGDDGEEEGSKRRGGCTRV